jgi:hypothetical protein
MSNYPLEPQVCERCATIYIGTWQSAYCTDCRNTKPKFFCRPLYPEHFDYLRVAHERAEPGMWKRIRLEAAQAAGGEIAKRIEAAIEKVKGGDH